MNLRRMAPLIILVATATLPAQDAFRLDRNHSRIEFNADHIVVLREAEDAERDYYAVGATRGHFGNFDIDFVPGADGFAGSRITATIQAASLDTENAPRDAHLKSDDFLDVVDYPTITFRSTAFEKVATDTFRVTGDLTIRDITRPVALTAVVQGKTRDAGGNAYISFQAAGRIDRTAFGLTWDELLEQGAFRVSKYIELTIQGNFIEVSSR